MVLTSLRRVIRFNDEGILEEQFIITRKVEDDDKAIAGKFEPIQNVFIQSLKMVDGLQVVKIRTIKWKPV